MSVGLVLVSHVGAIATGLRDLVTQMAPDVRVEPAGGTDDGGVGTSFDAVAAALEAADSGDGVVVLYDLGSAVMTTETALDLLDEEPRGRVRVADTPLVEGAVAAGVEAQAGSDVDAVLAAALTARGGSSDHAEPATETAAAAGAPDRSRARDHDAVRATATLVNEVGLHARPAGVLARALAGLDAELRVGRAGTEGVNARSVLSVIGLGLEQGAEVEYVATGPDAQQAVDTALRLTEERFGDER